MSTFMANKGNIVRKWYILDAAGKPLGKTAATAADLLRGKHKPTYTPHADCGDFVIIVNAEQGRPHRQQAGAEVLSHPLRLGGRPEGDQVPHPHAGEARAGHACGRARHDAPQHRHQGLSEASSHLSRRRAPSAPGSEARAGQVRRKTENVSDQESL